MRLATREESRTKHGRTSSSGGPGGSAHAAGRPAGGPGAGDRGPSGTVEPVREARRRDDRAEVGLLVDGDFRYRQRQWTQKAAERSPAAADSRGRAAGRLRGGDGQG